MPALYATQSCLAIPAARQSGLRKMPDLLAASDGMQYFDRMFSVVRRIAVALALFGCSTRTPVPTPTTDVAGTDATSSSEAQSSPTHSSTPPPSTSPSDGGGPKTDTTDELISTTQTSASSEPSLLVRVGSPDPNDALAFTPLPVDGRIKIRMGGQGGTHAVLGLQCSGFGNRILYEIKIEDLAGGGKVETPTLPGPRPIFCDMAGICKLVPINVVIGGLAPPEDWPNLPVKVTLTVSNADGLTATVSADGFLDPS